MSDAKNTKKTNSELHRLSTSLLVAVDTAFFGVNAASAFSASPLTWLGAFLFTWVGVFLTQKYLSEDDTVPALVKGFVLGALAGVPTPVAGILGGIGIFGKEWIKKLPKE